MDYILLSSLSLLIGIVVGLTGIGGASLITPMLIFVFQVPAAVAVSSDVVAATLMKGVGGFKHWRQQTLDPEVVKWLALGSVPGSLSGVACLHWLRLQHWNLDDLLLQWLGWLILLVATVALVQTIAVTIAPDFPRPTLPKLDLTTWPDRAFTIAIGAVLGSLVGLTSVSSGSLFALVLLAFFQLDASKLVGTDISQAAILLGFTSLGHLSLGTVDWTLVLAIWAGSVPGVLIGAKLCQFVPQNLLRFAIYAILVMVSWKLVYQSWA